ncbi:hypothetical protein [Actinomycetospora sp. NBC_00405]|uniref:hypothetical protein n=1 Tax=Actinomycetospora sp. NBC_00405 TaxID=2975952 RepID=UPI002E22AA53
MTFSSPIVNCNHHRIRGDATARLRVHAFTLTLDGFAAGTDQRADAPFGDGVDGLHAWMPASFRGDGAEHRVEALVPGESGKVHARVMRR